MKFISLILWVTQFGLSVLFPTCFFLGLAAWLHSRYGCGMWIFAVLGVFGFLTSVSTARSCLRSLRKEAERASSGKEAPIAFNEHS